MKYPITKALGIESSLKEGVYIGTVLLSETLKDVLAHCSCVLNSVLAGLARDIVGVQITLEYRVVFCWKMWMSSTSKLVQPGQL